MNSFRLALFTWNLGGAQPGIVPGTDALLRSARHADVIVVGLQEVTVGRRGWKTELIKALGPAWVYIGGESYAGMRLRAFSRLNKGKPLVSVTPGCMRVGFGFGDKWPNKGAVAVDISFGHACRVIFVVAHLAANEDQLQGRADDWRSILRRLDRVQFLSRKTDPSIVVPLFHQYDHVFVLGDLNYRVVPLHIDPEKRFQWVQERVTREDWNSLVAVDQLRKERLSGKVFANFQEAPIHFPPTFKIDPKSGQYNDNRIPSYCDRILWHSLPSFTELVECVRYSPLLSFKQSDHFPLCGEYKLKVPIVMPVPRPLRAAKGIRIVLEFTLVRFLKRTSTNASLLSSDYHPIPVRCVEEQAGSRLSPSSHGKSVVGLHSRSFPLHIDEDYLLPDKDEEEDEDDSDEDEREEVEDDAYASSSSFSSDEDENNPNSCNSSLDCNFPSDEQNRNMSSWQEAHFHRSMGSAEKGESSDRGYKTESLSHHTRERSEERSSYPSWAFGEDNLKAEKYCSEGPCLSSASSLGGARHQQVSPRLGSGANDGPRKRDSLSQQITQNDGKQKTKKRSRLNGMRMEVHGQGLFLKRGRIYEVGIPKRTNGTRERIGDSLPVIPLVPLHSLQELEYRHVLVEFARKKSRVGTSGVLPLRPLLPYVGKPYAFELYLTKYGKPVGTLEACVQLTVSDCGHWVDSQGRMVRLFDGSSAKNYRGPLRVRERTKARSRPNNWMRR